MRTSNLNTPPARSFTGKGTTALEDGYTRRYYLTSESAQRIMPVARSVPDVDTV